MQGGLLLAGLALCLVRSAVGTFFIEQGGLKIAFPPDAARDYRDGFDMSLANFGSPRYGGELRGKLVYPKKGHTCSPSCNFACKDFKQADPPYDLKTTRSGEQDTTYIMLVDRGPIEDGMQPCKFAEKVWNAQNAGAQGVIVVNYEDKDTTMEAPQDQDESLTYLKNITIPAAFIKKLHGDKLKKMLEDTDVYVVMDWHDVLPRASKVEWEFWTNSNDQCGALCDVQKEFIKDFSPIARQLEEGNHTLFTPHYIVWVCPDTYRDSEECKSQCIHHGRYCTPDPDGDLGEGYSGKDIVQENIRQLCIFKLANDSNKPWVWWDYVTKFGEQCKMKDNKYNEECAEQVFSEVNGDEWTSLQAWRDCMGDPSEDHENPLMEEEMKRQRGGGSTGEVYILPTIRINEGQYRGKLAYHEVLQAICAAFDKGSEPSMCFALGDDNCRKGSRGHEDCSSRVLTGKTACRTTFSGYECTCGSGFISHIQDGVENCLNINECVSIAKSDMDEKCQCERCACHDTVGGYECIQDIKDECGENYGGCWHKEFTVKGERKMFNACKDLLAAYKEASAEGKSMETLNAMKLHTCECPPCFSAFENNGRVECVPKCNLDQCEEATGICNAAIPGTGTSIWLVIGVVLSCLAIVGAAGYVVYRLRIRSAMHQEIRAIMAQYMPLESQDLPDNHTTPPVSNGTV